MNAPAILYRHPDGEGSIIADHLNRRLIVCNDEDSATATVRIGAGGLRALATEMLKVADDFDAGFAGMRGGK